MFDDIGEPGEDPRWDIFADFHSYLERRFPLMYASFYTSMYYHLKRHNLILASRHKNLRRTKVHTYGLVYQWQGSNTDIKPILFTGHQGLFITFVIDGIG